MPTDPLQTSESLVFDGALGAASAGGLFVLLAGAGAWLLWRDRLALGTNWAVAFWGLRMVALGVALWMLVGPMRETVDQQATSQSIAILADVSESMDTLDPPDLSTSLRWTLATKPEDDLSPVVLIDRANVAFGMASRATQQVRRQIAEHRPVRKIKSSLEESRIALARATELCAAIGAQSTGQRDDVAKRVARIEMLLDGPIAASLDALQQELEGRTNSVATKLASALDLLGESLLSANRRIETLSRDLASDLAEANSAGVWATDDLTRREKMDQTLDQLEGSVLGEMAEEVRVRRFRFDSQLMPVATGQGWVEPETASANASAAQAPESHTTTNLAAVLKQLAKDRSAESTRLVVLLSDGHHNALNTPAPQEVAAELSDLPVYVVPVGSAVAARDLRLHRVEAPSTVVENDSVMIDAIVTAVDCDGLSTEIVLRQEGEEVESQRLTFEGERIDRRVQFRVPADRVGWQEYELVVQPVEDEAVEANNVLPVAWEVVRDKQRILLADGVSQWEYRYLQQLFRRDSHVEFDELLFYPRLRGTGQMERNPRFPEEVDDWAVYDVVILGDIGARQFSRASQTSLVEYVRERNGNVILIAGRDHMPQEFSNQPLMTLLPVKSAPERISAEAYSLVLTDEGQLHSAMAIEDTPLASEASWHNVFRRTPVHGLSIYCEPKSTAHTLLRAIPTADAVVIDQLEEDRQQPAFLCWHQVGAGRVVYLAAPQTYLLRFRRGDRMHHRFWGQMLRWLTASHLGSGSDLVRLTTDQTRYHVGESVEATVWLKDQTGRPLADQAIHVVARTLNQTIATVPLKPDNQIAGRYSAAFDQLAPGAYEIVAGGSAVDELLSAQSKAPEVRSLITIESSENVEMLDTRANLALLEQLAEMTGGRLVPPTAIAEVLRLASLSPEVKETVHRLPLWNRWSNLWIVVGCLLVEWVVRKSKGLV